jgi:branched-chain amino acid transport system substrate-binding protein
MRTFKFVGLFMIVAMLLSACGGAAPGAAPAGDLKMAVLAPLSGPVPTFGVSTRDGALMAIEEWNAKGGVNGQKIVPIVEDSQCTPDPAVNAANKVIDQDKAHYIIGEVCSKASIPVSEIANAKKVVQISPTSTNTSVTVGADGKVKDYIFRACFIDPFQGAVMARFAVDELHAKRLAILFDFKQDYSVGLADFFRETATKLGAEIVADERYTSGDIEFKAQLTTIRAAKPDAIFVPGYYTELGLIAKQARELGIDVPLLGGDGWDSEKTIEIGGDAVEGYYFSSHYAADSDNPRVQAFVADFSKKYGATPDAMAALGYDAALILVDALGRAGSTDGAKLRDAIAATSGFEGVTGKISMDPQRNARKDAVVLKIEGGKFRYHRTVSAE